jgi:hypothetical protein
MTLLNISDIGYEPKYYPRVNGREDWFTVNIYREALIQNPKKADPDSPDAFPPIYVVKATPSVFRKKPFPYLLIDGLHRIRAYHAAGIGQIAAVIERLPESKWFARSVELNAISKRAFDQGDKAFIAETLTGQGWSMADVAKLLQMKVESLEKIHTERCQRIKTAAAVKRGKPNGHDQTRARRDINGEEFGFLKAPFTSLCGTSKGKEALQLQERVTSRDASSILDSFIAVLEMQVLDMSDEAIVVKLERVKSLIG